MGRTCGEVIGDMFVGVGDGGPGTLTAEHSLIKKLPIADVDDAAHR
ncbi:hypothetical protein [Gordonia otitidis]|nr:hypothetical protein [Gordonia otitidis]